MRMSAGTFLLLFSCACAAPWLALADSTATDSKSSLQASEQLLATLTAIADDVHAMRASMEHSWSLVVGLLQLQQGQQLLADTQDSAPTAPMPDMPSELGKQTAPTFTYSPGASPTQRMLQSLDNAITALCTPNDGSPQDPPVTDSLCAQIVSNLDPILSWQQCGGKGASCSTPGFGPCEDAAWMEATCAGNAVCSRVNEWWWTCLPTTNPYPGSVGSTSGSMTPVPGCMPCGSPSPAPSPFKLPSPSPTLLQSPVPRQPSPAPTPLPHPAPRQPSPRAPPSPVPQPSPQSSPLPSPQLSPLPSPQQPPQPSPMPSPVSPKPGFVQAVGTRFFLDGRPWYFQGSNIYSLGVVSRIDQSKDTVEGVIKELAQSGLRVLRFWGFGHGWDDMTVDSTGNWTMNAAALDRLDFTVSCAAKYGMRVVFPFVNYEPDLTGINFWVNWTLGPGIEKERFYADSLIFSRYVGYAKSIILRTNPYTGRMYRDEPAILAWELMNEPHTVNGMELWASTSYYYGDEQILIGSGQPVGKLVQQWLCRAAAEIKQLDPYHMVTTGEEGYRAYGPKVPYNWLNNGLKGVDFEANVKCPHTDYHTIHTYPDNWNIPYTQFTWVVDNFIKDRAALAFAAGKPIVMEEYGCCKAPDYQGHRAEVYRALHKAVDEIGFAGCIVWQGFPWRQGLGVDSNYDVVLTEDAGQEIVKNAAVMNARQW